MGRVGSSCIYKIYMMIQLMEGILPQLIGRLSLYLQGFLQPRCRISSINSIILINVVFVFLSYMHFICFQPNLGLNLDSCSLDVLLMEIMRSHDCGI